MIKESAKFFASKGFLPLSKIKNTTRPASMRKADKKRRGSVPLPAMNKLNQNWKRRENLKVLVPDNAVTFP